MCHIFLLLRIDVIQVQTEQSGQILIDVLHGQPHYIIETTRDRLHPYQAYPLLNAIGSSLVIRFEMIDIEINLAICEFFEFHVGRHRESALYQRWYIERLYFLFVTYLIISRYRKAQT